MVIAHEMDFSPKQSAILLNVDSGELEGSPLSPLSVDSSAPLVGKHIRKLSSGNNECFAGGRRTISQGAGSGGGRTSLMQAVREQVELSAIALLLSAFKRTGLGTCKAGPDDIKMDISWPSNVRHVTHVTFDRFNGFLGLPVEFEVEVPKRAPSASASVFGVSAESMQCSYDGQGNSVPTILLLLQERLYNQDGLMAEGIFRINAENSQEEHVRDQLNKGVVPPDIDVHCLASLIKAWFRELPKGVLDNLSPDQVMQCHTEEQCLTLVKTLPPTKGALLNWAINLMADVVQMEQYNKMNARNIAMVFAPNMTQMSDPLTALMHAVQVMNLLKSLILKTLKDRAESLNISAPLDRHDDIDSSKGPGLFIDGAIGEVSSQKRGGYLDGYFKEKESSEDVESAHDSEEVLLSSKANTDEGIIFIDSEEQVSSGSSTFKNLYSEIEDVHPSVHETGPVSEQVSKPGAADITSTANPEFSKPQCLASVLAERSKTVTLASALAEKKNTARFGGTKERKSLAVSKRQRGRVVGNKVNGQHSERVEAW